MKRSFKILLSVVFLIFFIQIVAAEQIIVPSTDSDGVSWTAPTTGTYRFTYTGGAVRGPDSTGSICGYCLSGWPCWSNVLYFYKNREATWGGSCIEPGCCQPTNPDYALGTGNYYTSQEAEAAAIGTYFDAPLNQGDQIILLCPDYSNSPWSQNTGNYYIEVRIPIVPDISGTWSGTYNNVGVEQYSSVYTITQNVDQISGTAAFVITSSNYAPQDVGKSFTYNFQGTIDENGNIHITGNVATAPPEIYSRCGAWDATYQLSEDGKTIFFSGSDQYGNSLDILLHRGTQNQPPVANAGPVQTVTFGTLVTLDGTGSSDPDNNLPLTYAWIMSAPSGSTATLSSTMVANPTFTPDKSGDYVISLTVTDSLGLPSTGADSVTITVTNQPPVAAFNYKPKNPEPEQPIILDGSKSYDPEKGVLTFDWYFDNENTPQLNHNQIIETTLYQSDPFQVTLVVTDDKGQKGSISKTIIPHCSKCKVEVRAHPVPESLNIAWHTFIVYTDPKGKEWFYRGGPTYATPIGGNWYGPIITSYGPFVKGTIDYQNPMKSTTVLKKDDAYGKNVCFAQQMDRINSLNIPYTIHGPNSNTVTRSALHNCGCPEETPKKPVPGWNHPYI